MSKRGGLRPGAGRPKTRYIVSAEAVQRMADLAADATARAEQAYEEHQASGDPALLAEYYRNLAAAKAYQECLGLIEQGAN